MNTVTDEVTRHGETDVTQTYCLLLYHCVLKMASVNFLAQRHNGEDKGQDSNNGADKDDSLDSSFNLHSKEPTDSEPCTPDYSPIHSSE